MGSWDTTSFGNDTANDWAYELEGCNDLSFIDATLQKILDAGDEYIEAPDAEEAVAACEVLAWLRGRPTPTDAFTEKIDAWVASHAIQPPAIIIEKAIFVLERIQREPSELLELWEGDAAWIESMSDLRGRLEK